ncbi:MAG: GspE/PulE family protein [Granulosicoccus sp.]
MISEDPNLPEHMDLQALIPSPQALACLGVESARRLCVLPVALLEQPSRSLLIIACADASDTTQRERIIKHIDPQYCVQFINSPQQQLRSTIHFHYQTRPSLETMLECASPHHRRDDEAVSLSGYPVELVNALIRQAARMRASDMHVSPESDCVQIRFRVDGVLQHQGIVDKSLLNGLLVRIKIMASLDIAETRYPQDGQFRRIIDARPIDFRVSTFPTVAGENTVLRLIDDNMQLNSLDALDLSGGMVKRLSRLMQKPDGLIVVCGPTGAGKSTTLFALLDQINSESLSIMTLEDPVEHRVSGIRQTTIDAARQWGYAQGLRALLRQDPDVLLIGEVRDAESCEMALRAVSTGHQILTTVHAGCAHSALHRLRELNASGGALALGLVAMIAQRLVRKVCRACDAAWLSCSVCHGTGYAGRQVIMELLEVTADIKSMLLAEVDIDVIQKASLHEGFLGMREQAMAMVASGDTNLQEVERVFGTEILDE